MFGGDAPPTGSAPSATRSAGRVVGHACRAGFSDNLGLASILPIRTVIPQVFPKGTREEPTSSLCHTTFGGDGTGGGEHRHDAIPPRIRHLGHGLASMVGSGF